jgi:hypothetical protein
VAGPSIEQVPLGFTVTVFVQVDEQPSAATVVVSVNDPLEPASTVTDRPSAGPTIVPLPEIWVETVAPGTLVEIE